MVISDPLLITGRALAPICDEQALLGEAPNLQKPKKGINHDTRISLKTTSSAN
ncbi:hypothetical protein [Legionella donaldsonii]|uniref:hypothetical protein n=1 Tax=Legionella donaldsonii TaxID=45060 RepID=UPI00399C5201